MTVRIYRSTDSGAPTLSGEAGKLINVLDACLVNGYGSKAAAGWTKPYSGTNKAVYRQPAGTNQQYLRVDDSNAQYGLCVGYEAMTDVDTGTGPYPTAAQMASGVYSYKSTAANTTARAWMLATNGDIFYLFVDSSGSKTVIGGIFFGGINSRKSGDAYRNIIIGSTGSVSTQSYLGSLNNMSAMTPAHYMARSHTQTGTAIAVGKHSDMSKTSSTTVGRGNIAYPDAVNSELMMSPLHIHESVSVLRGRLPGLWSPDHDRPIADGDTFSGSGDFASKTFEAKTIYSSSTEGRVFIETSDTW